jgi:hypothetical protein
MQISGEYIENMLVNMALKKETLKWHRFGKTPFHGFLFENGQNKFHFAIIQVTTYDLWNLKLSYLNQLEWIIITNIRMYIPTKQGNQLF